ncbi:MAG: D-alanine--D-alanine ligase [Propionibacteriaceae bacterium]|jgi:D-alanine-D-alanine ligase|nr:D-alanine--D-alanine ligase [Propionibacteriaceae bacterium]
MDTTVIILSGGLSHEREISLHSGHRVSEELRGHGFTVVETDLQGNLIELIKESDHPIVFPLLHGGSGEDGAVREVLELLDATYIGSSAASCRVSFDKAIAVPLVAQTGVRTPKRVVLPHDMFRDLGASTLLDLISTKLGLPLIVKPTMSGSALGYTKVTSLDDLPGAMVLAYSFGRVAVIEEFIEGTEVAVPVVDYADGPRAYPPVEIRPNSGVYDFEARYTPGATDFISPADLPESTLDACRAVALAGHRALGLRDLSRADIIVTPEGEPVFLEMSVAPGMTDTSVLPLSIESAGESFADVLAHLVRQAAER